MPNRTRPKPKRRRRRRLAGTAGRQVVSHTHTRHWHTRAAQRHTYIYKDSDRDGLDGRGAGTFSPLENDRDWIVSGPDLSQSDPHHTRTHTHGRPANFISKTRTGRHGTPNTHTHTAPRFPPLLLFFLFSTGSDHYSRCETFLGSIALSVLLFMGYSKQKSTASRHCRS